MMHLLFRVAILLIILVGRLDAGPVEIIAHRGASHDAPENTMAALRLGWEQKADANELDVHLTKDGQIAVMHDATTKRTALVDKPIAAQTLAELRVLDAGSWKGKAWKGEKIPTLSEALADVPDGKRMFIEIKCGPEILPELERVLKASGHKPEKLVIIGFDYDTMKLAKERFPHLQVYWLVSPTKESQGRHPPITEMIDKAKAAHLDGLNLSFKFVMDSQFAARVKDAGLKFYVWTVDELDVAQQLIKYPLDGITTNRPLWLREHLLPQKAKVD